MSAGVCSNLGFLMQRLTTVEEFEQNNWVARGESHRLFDRRELSFDTKAQKNLINLIEKISVNFFL